MTLSYSSGQTVGSYYSHSGKAPPAGVIAGLVVGLIAAPIVAAVYAYGDLYIPFVYLNILLTLAFGAALGLVPSSVLRRSKVRNAAVVLIVVGICTLVGYYFSWVFWCFALLQKAHPSFDASLLVRNPRVLYEIILDANEKGTWSMGHGDAVNGIALWGFWAAEAICIFVAALGTSRTYATSLPFCEKCNQWCDKARVAAATAPLDPVEVKRKVEASDFAFTSSLARVPGDAGQFFQWEYSQCPSCKQFNTLSVMATTVTRDKKGRVTRKKTAVVPRIIVETSVIEKLKTPQPAVAPAAPGPTTVIRNPSAPPLAPAAPPPASSAPVTPPLSPGAAFPLPSEPTPPPAPDKPLLDL